MEQQFERRPWLLPAMLAILTILFLRPVLLPPIGNALASDDLLKEFYPLHGFIQQSIRGGEFPLWNPHVFIGHPIAGDAQAALFYPASWVIWLVGAQRGIGLMLIFHTWLAAWGMARLMRSFGSTYIGGLLAGVVYAMSGWMAARYLAGHYSIVTVSAWTPWILLAYRYALRRNTWRAALPGMAALGLAILSGSPPILVYIGLSLAALWVYQVALEYEVSGGADTIGDLLRIGWRSGRWLMLIGIGGAILGAALLLPTAELTSLSARTEADLSFADKFALPPAQLLTLAFPTLFGEPNATPQPYWGADFYQELNAYAGLLPLLAVPLCFQFRRRENLFFLGLIALGLTLALGLHGALLPLLVRWLPGFGLFRSAGRSLYLLMFGLAGLTALLMTELQHADQAQRRTALRPLLRRWLPISISVAFVGTLLFSGWYASASHVEPMPTRALIFASALAETGVLLIGVWFVLWLWTDREAKSTGWAILLTCVLVILDAWHVGLPIISVKAVDEPALWAGARLNIPAGAEARLVAPLGFENQASLSGLLNVAGYDPLPIDSYDKLQKMSDAADPTTPINTLLGVKYVLRTEPYDKPNFELIGIAGGIFYRRKDPFPRAWIAQTLTVEPNDDAVRQRIVSGKENLLTNVFIDQPSVCPTSEGSATIMDYRADSVQIKAGGGLLILSDQYYPGWQATIDGQSAEIVRADTAFRAVCVPPGDHIVRFEYRPRSLYIGMLVSGAGWLMLLLAALIRRR